MAIVTTKTNPITGAATNTLGTLGRSLFNSTIGTFADKDTMNQLYSVVDKLNSSIETIDKNFDNEAFSGRNKADDLHSILAGLDLDKFSYSLMNNNTEFMKRLMRLNKQEKDITLNALGVDVSGKSHVVKNEYLKSYDYIDGNDYYENYVKNIPYNQAAGDDTTSLRLESSNHYNYSGIHNDLYSVQQNLYPDEENTGTFANKWVTENQNSILYKTKKIYNSKKIGTIISAFHTNPYNTPSAHDNAKSKYGQSHGRNLLTKAAERGYNSYRTNGYDNPYCRVWTHHHKYDRIYKMIRPFSQVDDNGNYSDTISVKDFHQWSQFSDSNDKTTEGQWGWKKDKNNGWQNSVLQDNGHVNITPKYINGEASNIHTKQCMFSIENLAWKGYDPYSFEQALSWEQRGPLGGRIMWFPPYGINFQETTSTDWQATTFLGRGEDVYTYAKTTRTGTLNFMMVVDHPSIIDYVTWTNANKNVTDTDILRFFAGCGEGDGDGFRDLAKPTPLTDEYTQAHEEGEQPKEPTEPKQKQEEKEITPDKVKSNDSSSICFYVFYPNNYSGTYDDPYGGEGYRLSHGLSRVEAIPYLLTGKGAQKSAVNEKVGGFDGDIYLNELECGEGNGYEMGGSGLGEDGGYIAGTSLFPNTMEKGKLRYWTNLGTSGFSRNDDYSVGNGEKKWYYRIDGRYTLPKSQEEEKMHYYNQKLPDEEGYIDKTNFNLNKKIESIANYLGDQVKKNEDNDYILQSDSKAKVYTLAEIASVLYEGNNNTLSEKCGIDASDNRIQKLKQSLNNEVTKISAMGFASSHGYEELNKILAKHRAQTAANWFKAKKKLNISIEYPEVPKNVGEINESNGDYRWEQKLVLTKGGGGKVDAKKWRYAKVIIEFKTIESTMVSESDSAERAKETTQSGLDVDAKNVVRNNPETYYIGYSPTGEKGTYNGKTCDIVINTKTKKKFYKVVEDNQTKYMSVAYAKEENKTPTARYGDGNADENRVRYDQEYHFFKVLKQTDPLVFNSLMDKLQYFDPAFHSMTPEGFNGRLTFLQQCMRQGNTVSATDGKFAKAANNLAFGRAPYCVLRLGDFYNQMIVIDNLSINYDPLVWDLNVEGVGVQPLIANVSISFKFVGGGDLTGPVRRLQNAMSFNYYANARLYDNRADRVERAWSDKTCGAIGHDEILENNSTPKWKETYNSSNEVSSFYTPKMYE